MAAQGSFSCEPAADDKFGPAVASCARSFDFTLLFEQSFLSIAPSIIFLFLSIWRLFNLRLSSQKTRRSWMSTAKPILALALILSQLSLLVLYIRLSLTKTRVSIPATVLSLFAAVTIVPLSYCEQNRSVRPSTLLSSYLSLSIILDLPQARTFYLIPSQLDLAVTFSVSLAVKVGLLLLEAWSKRALLEEQYRTLATEATSGILSRSLFLWMNGLFLQGFSKVISPDDLGPVDGELASAALHGQLHNEWMLQDRHVKWPLLRAMWRALRWSLLSPVPPRLCYGGLLFAQPFLINRAIAYLSKPGGVVEDDIGYGLIAAAGCVYLGIAISTALYKHQLYRHITMVRGSLVSVIYSHSLSMEGRVDDPSTAVTLMSTDVDRICQSLVFIHDTWSRTLELVVGVSLLALQIGWVSVMPLVVAIISALLDSRVTLLVAGRVKTWTDAVQRRTSLTADILSSMKSVKILGLTRPLHTLLQSERLRELRLQAKFRWSTVWLNTLGNVPPALTPVVTFIAYAIKARSEGSSSLDTSQAFTSLALISLVTTPATELLGAFPATASCLGCLRRIQEHLMKASHHDQRILAMGMVGTSKEKVGSVDNSDKTVACLSHMDVKWFGGSNPILKDLNLTFHQNTLTMILGPSGSGKSMLLRAMLGEARYNGTVSINTTRIAFCSQSPWLFTGSIQQNICGLGGGVSDYVWYKSVLHACALDDDLLALTQGDRTSIKGQAAPLSGGQKQRIALARALYQRPQLVLLDDVFSAVDAKTEAQVMKRLLGSDGLLRKLEAAVLLVTHTRRYEEFADNVIQFDGEGNAVQSRNTRSLDHETRKVDPEQSKPGMVSSDLASSREYAVAHDLAPENHSNVKLPQHDGDFADYIYYFKTVKIPLLLMFSLFASAQTVCYYMSQVILQWWTADHGSDEATWMPTYVILAIGNALFFGCTIWIMFLKLVPESGANLHRVLLDSVMSAPYSFFVKTSVGVILNRFSQDMTLIDSQLPTGVVCTVIYLFWTIGSLALISTGSSWMVLTVPAVLVTLFFIQRVYLRTSRRLRVIELELRSPMYSHFMETLNGLSTIRAFKWEEQFTGALMAKLDVSQVPYYLLYCAQRWLQLVLDLIVAALAVIVMTLAVKLRSSTNPGSLGISLNNILSFNETLSLLLQYWTQLEVSLGAIARTREFADETPTEPNPLEEARLSQGWPDCGSIEICNLRAHYTGAKVALDNITMSIRPGEKIGLCGRTGSGKSSLLSAILRLLEPSHGSVIIDGANLDSVPYDTIRERLLTIPQDPFLLQHTVRFNLDPQEQYCDTQLINALSKVSLWSSLERRGGLGATVTSDLLSQGQKQLFSLSRAILRTEGSENGGEKQIKGKVLLLDEATSNVDMATDALMQHVIRDAFPLHTILVVAHRLDTVLDSDRIAVLDAGRLIEFDSPQVLLSRNSAFSALYNSWRIEEL